MQNELFRSLLCAKYELTIRTECELDPMGEELGAIGNASRYEDWISDTTVIKDQQFGTEVVSLSISAIR